MLCLTPFQIAAFLDREDMKVGLSFLDEAQQKRFNEWASKHKKEVHSDGVRDISGAWVKFTIIPSGMGDSVMAECIWCVRPPAKLSLTYDDWGEFIDELAD